MSPAKVQETDIDGRERKNKHTLILTQNQPPIDNFLQTEI